MSGVLGVAILLRRRIVVALVDSTRGVNWSKRGESMGGEYSSVEVAVVLEEAESEVVISMEWSSESGTIWSLWVMEVDAVDVVVA
jgi:hypothetical protein